MIEIFNNQTWTELATIKTRYPNFVNYIIKRFGDFESRYPDNKFQFLFESLVINNQAELAFAETLVTKTNTKLNDDQLGDIAISSSTNENVGLGDNTTSYQGYNVENDYAKVSNSRTTTNNANAKSSTINYFSYLAGINQNYFKDTWKTIIRQFLYLVRTIYLVENM